MPDVSLPAILRRAQHSALPLTVTLNGFTGCSNISALPMEKDLSGTSELTDLLHAVGGLISKSLHVVKAPRKGLRASLSALLTPHQREPLP